MTPSLFGRDGHHFIADPDSPDTCRRCRRPKTEHAPAETAAMAAGPMTFAGVTRAERARLAEELLPNGRVWGR
jgi:hypothetical protein